jgi:ABC-type oligopeptide transport system ATPase subunit
VLSGRRRRTDAAASESNAGYDYIEVQIMVRHISHRIVVLYLGKVMEVASGRSAIAAPLQPYTVSPISAVLSIVDATSAE